MGGADNVSGIGRGGPKTVGIKEYFKRRVNHINKEGERVTRR